MNKKLKPCPFCGGEATIIKQKIPEPLRTTWGENAPEKVLTVGCHTENCIVYHTQGNASLVFYADKRKELIEAWNRRAERGEEDE